MVNLKFAGNVVIKKQFNKLGKIMNKKIAFIGAGNMAIAMIRGLLLAGYDADQIIATGTNSEKLTQLQDELKIHVTTDNAEAIMQSDVVFLAVKPQLLKEVIEPLKEIIQSRRSIIISVAAGITFSQLHEWLGKDLSIVCAMPNLPVKIGEGMSGLFSPDLNDEDKKTVDTIFNLMGKSLWLEDESLMRVLSSLSGSGPAIIYYVIEALREAGAKLGLSFEDANTLSLQMVIGSVLMANADKDDVSKLRKQVTSPKGTTEQAIMTLEKGNLKMLMFEALNSAVKRSIELTKE